MIEIVSVILILNQFLSYQQYYSGSESRFLQSKCHSNENKKKVDNNSVVRFCNVYCICMLFFYYFYITFAMISLNLRLSLHYFLFNFHTPINISIIYYYFWFECTSCISFVWIIVHLLFGLNIHILSHMQCNIINRKWSQQKKKKCKSCETFIIRMRFRTYLYFYS